MAAHREEFASRGQKYQTSLILSSRPRQAYFQRIAHTRECDISTYVHGVSVHIVPVAGCNLIITGKLLVTLKIVHNPYTHHGFLHKVVGIFYMVKTWQLHPSASIFCLS